MKLSNILLPVLATIAVACEPDKPDPMVEKCAFIRKEIRDHLSELEHRIRNFSPNADTYSGTLDLGSLKWLEGLIVGEAKARDIFCPKIPDDKAVDDQITATLDTKPLIPSIPILEGSGAE